MNKLVFDVGGTFIKYALMDNEANIIEKDKVPTPLENREQLLNVFKEVYDQYKDRVDGIALSMPGNIDSTTGYMYSGGALMYNQHVNIVEEINKIIPVKVTVENDGKCAALAEVWKGNLEGIDNGIVLILGTGIGGGIVTNGKLHRGTNFFAGEFSFIIDEGSTFSFDTSFAAKASTIALLKNYANRKNVDVNTIDGYTVFNGIENNDQDAILALDEIAQRLAVQIYNFQCVVDPKRICVGGGISQRAIVIEKITEKLEEIYAQIPVAFPRVEITNCKYFNDSNLIGALYHFFELNK